LLNLNLVICSVGHRMDIAPSARKSGIGWKSRTIALNYYKEKTMLKVFKNWLREVETTVITNKKQSAKDPTLWEKELWTSPSKKVDIRKKFREELENIEVSDVQRCVSVPARKVATEEWLYDLASRLLDREGNLLEVFLTMEIAMSNPKACDASHAFKKLLQSDSRYKVFVFQLNSREDIVKGIIKLKNSAERYCFRSDSEFLLCEWSTSENRFFFDEFSARRITSDNLKHRKDADNQLNCQEVMAESKSVEFIDLSK
jgi:hypothetical protein